MFKPVADLSLLPVRITSDQSNLLILQILSKDNPEYGGDKWLDYASIKDSDDLRYAKRIVEQDPLSYRILAHYSILPA